MWYGWCWGKTKQERFFDEVVMVTVSQQPDFKKIQGEIAEGVGLTLQGDNLWNHRDRLVKRLKGQDSILVILDDVWEALDLNKLGIPSGSNHNHRCKVILTTRLRDVCVTMEAQKIIDVGILSDEEGWILFTQKAGYSVDDPSLPDIAKDVANECKGLPLAIITVAGALKHKAKPLWEDALKQLHDAETSNIRGVHTKVYKPLKLSYDYLESDQVRYLFLLCSLFEEDSNIYSGELLRYGMGLRIFSETANYIDMEHARNRVCLLLETLKDSFLLSQGSRKDCVKMHDVVRDVAIYIASEGTHISMVCHDVNSEEFPRKDSYEQYSHMSIVANKFDECPRPILCPKLKLLMLKLCFEEPFKLEDDFFNGMSKLNVLSIRGERYKASILHFPASIQRLSNLRTLCLSNLRLDDISIIGELVTLEILSIRDSDLEELPVEIGKLTNLIMLEFCNGRGKLKRISPGVLSRLVRLEELHMMVVEHCSYSTLRELESLSRLTALTLIECSKDVIYSNLGLSSKLTRYTLTVAGAYIDTSTMDGYDKNITLEVMETTRLGDWICHLLRKSELVRSKGKGSKNVLPELQLDEFQNVKDLYLRDFDSVTHSLKIHCQNNIPFPKLEKLEVSCPNLEKLCISRADSISALCSHQLPTGYFSKLVKLEVHSCGKLRNLMSPSVATGLLNLQILDILDCESMEEVITEEEQQGEEMTNEPLFPRLENLELYNLPKLRHFFHTKHALEFPFLQIVRINDCPEMKTFVQQGSVSTPSLGSANHGFARAKVDDLNKWIQQI